MSGKRGKNDAADAAAICEAVRRPHMRFVPVKEEHQQMGSTGDSGEYWGQTTVFED